MLNNFYLKKEGINLIKEAIEKKDNTILLKASEKFIEAINLNNKDINSYLCLAEIYQQFNLFDLAEKIIIGGLKNNPSNYILLNNLDYIKEQKLINNKNKKIDRSKTISRDIEVVNQFDFKVKQNEQ
ncbi:MAG: hypothetical protein U0457_01680 [Candidatus Sericytochromatia bacterium]